MKFHNMTSQEIYKKLKTSDKGLSVREVNDRLSNDGKNIIKHLKAKSDFSKFLEQFKNLMIVVLVVAAICSFVISYINNESYTDSIVILAIVILNAIIGFIQEKRADKSIESLKKMQVSKVRVRRDNKTYIVNSEDIVKGDILVLEAGDMVPADARIIWSRSLKVDESALTGESVSVSKSPEVLNEDLPFSEITNMVFQGTNVVYGKCEAVVCLIGSNTEFGKVAESLIDCKDELTPLQKKIANISRVLTLIVVVIIVIMFIIGIINGMKISNIVILSISLAVAAIPEGLPAVITIVLSIGMNDLAKKRAIVKKMNSVETLGSTEIICSDKTGTITQNKMTVKELFYNNTLINPSSIDKSSLLVKMMILNNDATLSNDKYIGDPTETALLECYNSNLVKRILETNKRVDELPFDSNRKMMSIVNDCDGEIELYVKGSFDSVINRCNYIFSNDKIVKFTDKKRSELLLLENEESNKAYRLLAFAYKKLNKNYKMSFDLENDLVFIGMAMMIDPAREDVKDAIKMCLDAHIKPIMITGDSLMTARAIAREVGILCNDNEVVSGSDIDKMSFDELKEKVNKYSVYARVSPINKLNIVNAWKANGKVVAMTGDGVNDAPALKTADIGIGMGITGTEVSKSVSDIILTDDSFSTIVSAVREGRRIFDNIRNVLVYLLVGNIAEVIVVFIGMAMGIEIFSPMQLLYINLVTDSIPAISLAFERESKDIMKRNVRQNDGTFFTSFLVAKIAVSAVLKTITMLLVYAISYKVYGVSTASTMTFLALILLEMIYTLSCKNLKSNVIDKNIFNNKFMNIGMVVLLIIQILVFITPFKYIFGLTDINLIQVLYCIIIVVIVFIIDELSKILIVSKFKD